jgi:hypothetical protein
MFIWGIDTGILTVYLPLSLVTNEVSDMVRFTATEVLYLSDNEQQVSVPPAPPQYGLDIVSEWAREGIRRARALQLIPPGLFAYPAFTNYTYPTTRAEFTALAVALYETVTGGEITGRMEFNDTNDINVQKMGYLGVVTGVGNGNFAPFDTITRQQAAVMLSRLANIIGHPLPDVAPTFADNANISSWAFAAVGHMQGSGIMSGKGNNNFSPSGDYTREQSIITILRLFDRVTTNAAPVVADDDTILDYAAFLEY